MRSFRANKAFLGLLVIAILGMNSGIALADYTISMNTPSLGANWAANANLTVSGSITWEVDAFNNDQRPTACVVFIHAGTNGDPVTNSAQATISNITDPPLPNPPGGVGDEDYNVGLNLTPSVPPLGGGGGAYAVYTIQATASFKTVVKKTVYTQINVQNG